LDADKEGFLRNEPTMLQMMGRAARHPEGHVILYADSMTQSMERAIQEVEKRREIQKKYNADHHIKPKAIIKPVREWLLSKQKEEEIEFGLVKDISLLKKEMREAASAMDFERAAALRDMIEKLKKKS
jgi:excinuclease ABC subunit B